ncbi:hypothetical protein COCHEDRAFT_1174457 [Bipolaris maydis C5]|uniref:Fe2OG dioxygenase domain-containing protein n=1 Tax=Cochliobolus heterostrophus (strain C5 / ATCC 48332 / race O) TaxID=701091 RepID=M2T4F9_COCH5|nr:hypothetical protein COCHEDRAFT_1174457 [Bipolaris maydis C5]KAH7552887.1 hypothetical protein BM1_07860 [Bipolaris maydis]KAJ5022286.1 hypothetical protein J3E73DRAFT_426928 [Bipolaris maydis]KAJ5060980.1 flavonol synthase/flavanone 3-hydroxylase [Bipolaris maydis]KAJ6198111.1 flavonol synthase/flavanone 3-hydroxylase [Bipolaris maydis]
MCPEPSETDRITYEEARNGAAAYLQSRLSTKNEEADKDFEIPVIDLEPSFSDSLSERQKVADQIRKACTTSGFFYITNHRIPKSACDGILHQAKRFMKELPLEKKEELHLKKNKFGLGWEPSEYTSIAGDKEEKEVFNFAYEADLDPTGGDGQYKNLDGSTGNANMWPKEEDLPGFYTKVKDYYGNVLNLARHLFRLFALSLSLPESHFDPLTTHPGGIARLLYYPPPSTPLPAPSPTSTPDQQIGLGAHSDYECFTLLLPSSTPGLEILKPSGSWYIAPHLPGTLIVNVADFLMRWTNGLYKSTVHRVVNRSREERYSVPFFFSVNYDAVVETLPGCLDEAEGEARWRPVRAGEYILERLNATTAYGKGFQA